MIWSKDVSIRNLLQLHASGSFLMSCSSCVFRKGAGGAAGHCWPDSQGDRPGCVQVWSVRWQGHRKVVQRWSGGVAKRTHQNDSHRKVRIPAGGRNDWIFVKSWRQTHFCCFVQLHVVSGFTGWLLTMWSQRTLETTRLFLMDTLCRSPPNSTFWVRRMEIFSKLSGVHIIYYKCNTFQLISSLSMQKLRLTTCQDKVGLLTPLKQQII